MMQKRLMMITMFITLVVVAWRPVTSTQAGGCGGSGCQTKTPTPQATPPLGRVTLIDRAVIEVSPKAQSFGFSYTLPAAGDLVVRLVSTGMSLGLAWEIHYPEHGGMSSGNAPAFFSILRAIQGQIFFQCPQWYRAKTHHLQSLSERENERSVYAQNLPDQAN
jgi:hypothetical protein